MRNLDHFVMPVADLALARARYTALGFTVANDANHPFGTQNCCVFFADGTFIEPLAIGDATAYQEASAYGNAFVLGHNTYATTHNIEGFSHLVVKSINARADHKAFVQHDISGGEILDFSRTFTKADGILGEVAFSLAFANAGAASDAAFFSCEVVKAVPGGRGSLVDHANGVKRTKRVVLSADRPASYSAFFEQFMDVTPITQGESISIATSSGEIEIVTPAALYRDYGLQAGAHLSLQALVLQAGSLPLTRALLAQNSVNVHDMQNRITVLPSSGQGGTLIFEE